MNKTVLAFLVAVACAVPDDRKIPPLAAVPSSLPQSVQTELLDRRMKLAERYAGFKKRGDAFTARKAADQSDEEFKALKTERSDYIDAAIDFNKSVASALQGHGAQLVRGIRAIQVPPPIPPEEASIGIGRLAEEDETTRKVLLGTDAGVAILEVTSTIGGKAVPAVKLLLAAGKTFIAAENAADVYLVHQNEVYEKALRWLKDDATRAQYTSIVRALKENRPVSENASVEMVRTAEAMLDPRLGNSGMRMAWQAMWTPEARRAAVTQACIELGGELVGEAAGKVFKRIQAAHSPVFREANEFLSKAAVALEQTSDPAARASLGEAVRQANGMIADTYRLSHLPEKGLASLESIFVKHAEEEQREQKKEK